MTWIRVLVANGPHTPICPVACVFSRLCKPLVQLGVNRALISGKLARVEDCVVHHGLRTEVAELDIQGYTTSDELIEALGERFAIEGEGAV